MAPKQIGHILLNSLIQTGILQSKVVDGKRVVSLTPGKGMETLMATKQMAREVQDKSFTFRK